MPSISTVFGYHMCKRLLLRTFIKIMIKEKGFFYE